ncbi:MAG: phage major capsid protein [Acidobacteriota bacterium]|nr:phage major capsid protein [Acidobacteriota bacterium]
MTTPNRTISALPTGTAFSRLIMAKALAHGDALAAQVISEGWRDVPQVRATLELETKASISPGTTSDAVFAGPLAVYGVSNEAISIERAASIVGQLIPKMRRVPFRVKVSVETGTGLSGAWVAENTPTPVSKTSYVSLSQEVYKAQVITAMSRELLMVGNPDAEATIRTTAMGAMAAFLDGQFLTSAVALVAGKNPAAITNGAPAVVSTGSTSAAISADLAAMLANISTAGSGLVWVMKPMTAYRIASAIGGAAAADVPRSLFGIPMILSLNSPQQVALIDAANVLYSDSGAIDVSVTEQASLLLDTSPSTVVQAAGAAPTHTSLFQNDLFAIRISRWLAYQVARTGGVTFMTVAY